MKNIWLKLEKPIWCLAPMFQATDAAFRQLLAEIGKPDLMMTEFTNVQALFSTDQTAVQQLTYTAVEQPLIAQIWGQDPELFEAAAAFLADAGFDGIDINMGCPENAVVKKGAGAALIDNPDLAVKIIQPTITGARGLLPVSVKTRIGNQQIKTLPWINFLLQFNLAAVSVHCRTARAMSAGPADWEEIAKIVTLRNRLKVNTLIIGNGDIVNRAIAAKRLKASGADGVMIGRGAFADPYIFNPHQTIGTKTRAEKLALLQRHLEIYRRTWGNSKSFHPIKRFFKIYVKGFPGALSLKEKLMRTRSVAETKGIIDQ